MKIKFKALFLMLGLVLGVNQVNAQAQKPKKDSVYVAVEKDEMTDKVYYYPSRQLVCLNDEKKQGFGISFFLSMEDGEIQTEEIKTYIAGIGSCQENNELIILLEGEQKITSKMWNEFNCKGNAWFKVTSMDKELLATKKVLKIRIQNGRTYDTYTHIVPESDQDYFIQLFYAVKNNKTKILNK